MSIKSLYIDLCNCLILICSIQHQMKVNLWTKNSYRLWLTNWPKTSKKWCGWQSSLRPRNGRCR
ncbi:hypothetical protein DWH01_23495 [Escherichia coli]|nr:hypothetical protein [Escherichia coli]EFI5476198.1 hypothetical protein [Escherichia coli]EFI6126450.1 hypothetical protein [Escherichia coli]EFO1670931.1 hypothetical protein [Escherichia coli]